MRNKLVVFEGIDGVGKTTLARLFYKYLRTKGIRVVLYEDLEKKDTGFNLIKSFVKKEVPVDSSLFFYLASSIYKSAKIRELLKTYWVICDRYIYSTLAFHKVRGAHAELLPPLEKLPIITPDYAFLVTASDFVRLKRVRARGHNTKADLIPKKKGNATDKMERALRKFGLQIIDNSRNDTEIALKKIIKVVFD